MEYQSTEDLIRRISLLNKVEATKKLTEYYTKARFKIRFDEFSRQYTDGSDDGGIDFYHSEETTFFIFQTKFSGIPKKTSSSEILEELRKLKNTLTNENPNRKAEDFVNAFKRETGNKESLLEMLWLTTNIVEQSVRDEVQSDLESWRRQNGWLSAIDFVAIDKNVLESVLYDVKHGYIPYTGKKTLKIERDQWMATSWEDTGVYSIVCSVNANDILKWFRSSDEIDKFLQKNVREFIGDNKINRAIGQSYLKDPAWFWYKHNGVIIFSDNLHIDREKPQLILRNPQVVNGGQTLKALYTAYDKDGRADNSAKILLRIYRLPYEDTETYKRSIDIISALNSQNKINPSDLRSTDPRQVRLEEVFLKLGNGYKYFRKRSKEAKSSRYCITMKNLALRYYICRKNAPQEGVRGNVEELFEEDAKYNEIFDENAICKELTGNHVAINYIACWNIDQIIRKVQLPKRDAEYSEYTKWFVLTDAYRKLLDWKQRKFHLGWQMWVTFLESYPFEKAILDYCRSAFKIARLIIPAREEGRSFLRTVEAAKKFKAKSGARNFETNMNKALARFEREND